MATLAELSFGGVVLIQFLTAILSILIGGAILHLAVKILKIRKAKWGTAFTVAAINSVVSFIFGVFTSLATGALALFLTFFSGLVGLIVFVVLVKSFYDLKWGKSFIVALVVWAINFLIIFLLVMLFVVMLAAAFIAV